MAVTLIRAYLTYAAGATVSFDTTTEAALIAQGLATAATGFPTQSSDLLPNTTRQTLTSGGNVTTQASGAGISVPTAPQGARILPNTNIQAFASLGTNTTMVAGTLYRSEIFVPHLATWTGIGILNGATVGTDNALVALYDTNGVLITNSAVAGAVAAGANAFQNYAFLNTVTLTPGRYFIAVQQNGTTATKRTHAAANGGNQMTASSTGTFGTVPTSFTPPTTFTADVGPIGWLYQ
jgi:hypothetical protein